MRTLPTIDHTELRRALGSFPTGVTVITTLDADGVFVGLTVNSFNSLSLDPPLVLWSLGTRSSTRRAFEDAGRFAVNILAEDQAAISQRFASSARNRFHGVDTHAGLGGTPLIDGCAAYIECRAQSMQLTGDHLLFIGRVEQVRTAHRRPLVYVGGRYCSVGAEAG
ncbi:MAG: flavin reductase family protein [Burkholderiaceae bacterium]|nr:flavin reductase family protein [Burkholderiaceae bacterium]MEB2352974.1 flavin reductase family protein [Burkholderiaceae bacterium]